MIAKKPRGGPEEYKSTVRPAIRLIQRTFGRESLESAKSRSGRNPKILIVGIRKGASSSPAKQKKKRTIKNFISI